MQLSRQKKELLLACEERDNHQLDKEMLTNRLRHLEAAEEAGKNGLNEKTREIRILEVKYVHLFVSVFGMRGHASGIIMRIQTVLVGEAIWEPEASIFSVTSLDYKN